MCQILHDCLLSLMSVFIAVALIILGINAFRWTDDDTVIHGHGLTAVAFDLLYLLASLSISAVFVFTFIKARGTRLSEGLIWLPVLASFLCARSLLNVIERFTWDWELGALAQSDAGEIVIMVLEYFFTFWIFFGTLKVASLPALERGNATEICDEVATEPQKETDRFLYGDIENSG
ncbi:hypothetical protein LTS18_008472 [Coniosporium uncinatum]|uniref:Uncharacterized protein n=1 Tax=Coniosporium uncinatum TaxID=93489 RepID=A0ACC3DN85_9PEZI|nr:hypothetical protein LTS18_008472 [Coniosporium uncinatum]